MRHRGKRHAVIIVLRVHRRISSASSLIKSKRPFSTDIKSIKSGCQALIFHSMNFNFGRVTLMLRALVDITARSFMLGALSLSLGLRQADDAWRNERTLSAPN
jgi:hypothetical protein